MKVALKQRFDKKKQSSCFGEDIGDLFLEDNPIERNPHEDSIILPISKDQVPKKSTLNYGSL